MISAEEEKLLVASDLEPVKQFLMNSLLMKQKGEGYNYNHVVQQIRVRDDPEMLWRVYVGLCSCVTLFTQRPENYRDLIQGIFSYDWKGELKVTIAYTYLLGHLVSSNVTFLVPSFQMLVQSLAACAEEDSPLSGALQGASSSTPSEKQLRIHRTLRGLISLVPTGQSELFPILADHFPHKRFGKAILRDYVVQLLYVCEYIPVIQPRILDLIICRCLEIDVEIVIEDSGEVKIQEVYEGESAEEMFELEDSHLASSSSRHHQQGLPIHTQLVHMQRFTSEGSQRIPDEVVESADKLDAMLVLLLNYIEKQLQKLGDDMKNRLFQQLMQVFEERIVMTHRSKFVQYLLFYLSSQVEKYSRAFGDRLLRVFMDETTAGIRRQSSILYLASYLARANFIPVNIVSNVLAELLKWANTYVVKKELDSASNSAKSRKSNMSSEDDDDYDDLEVDEFGRRVIYSERKDSISKHETFYCCVQAACYVLCFYGTEVAALQRASSTTQKHWQRVITSSLMPLRYMLQSVRLEFVRLAQHVDLFDDAGWASLPDDVKDLREEADKETERKAPISSSSSRLQMSSSMAADPNSSSSNPLDSFFPFDPCLIELVHSYIDKGYRTWRGVPGLDLGDEDADISDDADDTDMSDAAVISPQPAHSHSRSGSNRRGGGGVRGGKSSAPRSVPGSSGKSGRKGAVDDGHDSDNGDNMSSIVSSMMSASMCSSVAHTYGTEGGVAMSIGAESTLAQSYRRTVTDRAHSGCSETSWEDDVHHDGGHDSTSSTSAAAPQPSSSSSSSSILNQQNLNRFQQLGPKLTHTASAITFKNGVNDNLATTAAAGAAGDNGGWPALTRRPRQYSIGSAGSW